MWDQIMSRSPHISTRRQEKVSRSRSTPGFYLPVTTHLIYHSTDVCEGADGSHLREVVKYSDFVCSTDPSMSSLNPPLQLGEIDQLVK